MSDRQERHQFTVSGYTRKLSEQHKINIPSEIVSIIFIFYYNRFFDFEYSKKIQVKDNVITNIDDVYSSLNTTVIGGWMDPDSDNKYMHTIRIKVINKDDQILIGITDAAYDLEDDITSNGGYFWGSLGIVNKVRPVEAYDVGDEVIMTLDLNELSISYKIIKQDRNESSGVLFGPQQIEKAKYKWAVSLDEHLDSCEIIDID